MAQESTPGGTTLTRTTFEIRPRSGGPPVRGDVRVVEGTAPSTAVVIAHGFKGFRNWGMFPPLARAAALRGHAAVTFDFSHSGVGADGQDFTALHLFADATHSQELRDLQRVMDALSNRRLLPAPPRAVGLVGHSRGGAMAVIHAADDPRVTALATWAAVADVHGRWTPEQTAAWKRGDPVHVTNARTGLAMPINPGYWRDLQAHRAGLDVAAAAARVEQPWLIVHGDGDESVPVADARVLFDAAGDEAELLLLEGANHTFGTQHPWAGPSDAFRAAAAATLDFFDAHLLGAGAAEGEDDDGGEGGEEGGEAPAAEAPKAGRGRRGAGG
jgi:dienelactone hydrolase